MPCKYITRPNSEQQAFRLESQSVKAKDTLFLDMASLSQWGEFSLPESMWQAFNRLVCWIEPVLVTEWTKTMQGYQGNQSEHLQKVIPH